MVAVPSLDVLSFIPKEIKLIAGIALFMYAGALIIEGIKFLVNLAIWGINQVNGCQLAGQDLSILQNTLFGDLSALEGAVNQSACIPEFQGLIILGINLTDFWTITALIFFPAMILLVYKFYAVMLNKTG